MASSSHEVAVVYSAGEHAGEETGSERAGWEGSDATTTDIEWLRRTRRIPEGVECRIPGDELVPTPKAGEFVVFLSHFERGFGLPASKFLRSFLDSSWDWNDGNRELNIEDARSLATDKWNLDHVDYFVDCHYSLPDDRLWAIGGTSAGTLGYFRVKNDPAGAIGSAEAILEGGHTGVIRTIYPAGSSHQNLGQNRGIFGWTGGEDGRLCCWRSEETAAANKSWISSMLVSRAQKRIRSSRHQPY